MKNIINSTWDTLDLPTKASIMRESLLKGITDIDVIRRNYDSKYLNVNMLPEVEDNFSRELLYDLYNKVEGNNRNNNMYPSNSYGNLFVDGGYTDDTPLIFEDVFYTDLGSIPTVRGKSNMPSSIQLTKELIKELKKKSHYQSFDYSHLSPDRRPMLNPTTFILVPIGYGLDGYQPNNNSGESVTYYIDDSLPPDENGNYILSKLDLDSPIGKTYSDWKMTQEAFKLRMSNPNMYNLSSEDAVTQIYDDNSIKNPEEDYIPLDEVEVLGTSKKGEGDKKEATTSVSTLTSGNGTLELGIPNPYNFKGDEIKVTLGDGSRGVPGAGLFGDKTGTDLIREYNSNGNPVYYYPGYSNGNNGYYYPSPITIKWPDNYNLPDYSSEYDATHDGVPVELLPFIEDDKLNLRDLLAWILTLMNNRNYPAGDDSEFLLPKRSKQVSPKQIPTLLEESHVFKNKKSKGGSLNKFPLGGSLLPILTPKYNTDENRRKLASAMSMIGNVISLIPNPATRAAGAIMTLPATGYDIYDTYNDVKQGKSQDYLTDGLNLAIDALPIIPFKFPKYKWSSVSAKQNRAARGAIAENATLPFLTTAPNLIQDAYSLFGPNYKNYIDDVGRPFKYSKDWNRFSVELPTITVTNKFDDGGFTYIPDNQQNMVVNPFEFEGIRYGWLPIQTKGAADRDTSKTIDSPGVYVIWDSNTNKWAKTRADRDIENILNYFRDKNLEKISNLSNQIIKSQERQSHLYQKILSNKSDLTTSDRTDLMPYVRDIIYRMGNKYMKPTGYAPADFFMDTKHKQKLHFIENGWTEGEYKNYGPIQKQAESFNRNAHTTLPVYKKNVDYINRDQLIPVGKINNVAEFFTPQKEWREGWLGNLELGLGSLNAGNFVTQIYKDKDNNLYQEAWDLNDYGNLSESSGLTGSLSLLSNLYDRIGNPTVVTTGILPIVTSFGKNANISDTTDMYEDKYIPLKNLLIGINKKASGGKVNRFDGYGPSSFIQTPWYDPWKGNPIGRQVAEDNARQQQLFQLSLDEYAKRLNEYINASDNWEYKDIEGDYPIATNIWTKETRIPIYKIPGSAMLKAFPNYTWNNGLTFDPNINYYTIRNAKGLYALVPQGSYISELMDLSFERDKALHPTKIAAADMTTLVANIPIQHGIVPTQKKQEVLVLAYPLQALLWLDTKSDYEHELGQNMREFNNWYTNYLKQQQLENTIRDMMFRPVTLTNYIRATGDAANGDDSWLGSFFDPNKQGMWFGLEGRAFLLNHPLVAGLLDFGVNMFGAKFAPKVSGVLKAPLKAAYNYSKPYVLHPTWKTYYHGRLEPIDFNNINLGTSRNLGLHVGDKRIAQLFAGDNGVVYKIRAPRSNAETIDIRANNYNLLSTKYPFNKTYGFRDGYKGDLKFNMLEEAGAKPTVIETPQGNLLYIENSVSLNLRERFPNVTKNPKLNAKVNELIERAEQAEKNGTMTRDLARQLNLEATKILSDSGYDVVKYANPEPGEMPVGQTKPYYSYFINNSDKMEIMPTWKLAWERAVSKSLKSTELTLDPTININTSIQPAFTYDPITGYTYTGFNKPMEFGTTFNTTTPRGFSIGPVLDTQKPTTAIGDNVFLINRSNTPFNFKQGKVIWNPGESKAGNARKTVHFTTSEPVTAHNSGNWNGASETALFPYRTVVQDNGMPINIEPMDTYFGITDPFVLRLEGAKIFTGNRKNFNTYKEAGVDVYGTEEGFLLQEQLQSLYKQREHLTLDPEAYNPSSSKFQQLNKLDELIRNIENQYDTIQRNWTTQLTNPTYQDYQTMEKETGLQSNVTPYDKNQPATALLRERGYTYHTTPTTHANSWYADNLTPQQANELFGRRGRYGTVPELEYIMYELMLRNNPEIVNLYSEEVLNKTINNKNISKHNRRQAEIISKVKKDLNKQ